MRIAVSSQNFRTITGHAGKSRRFIIYEITAAGEITELERLDLPKNMALHDYHEADHPLYQRQLDAIVTGGAGAGFIQRMNKTGIQVMTTGETVIATALTAIATQQPLPPALPHDDHDHHHADDEQHDQALPTLSVTIQNGGGHHHGSGCHCHGNH